MKSTLLACLALLLLLVACSPTPQEAAVQQEAVASTQAPAVIPTSTTIPTEIPTKTPSPTPEPPSVLTEYLDGVSVLYADPFLKADAWETWNMSTLRIEDGVAKIAGQPNWAGALVYKNKLSEGKGISLEFSNPAGADYEFVMDTGEFDTDSFLSFGILGGSSPHADLVQGTNFLGGNNLRGDLTLRPDKWYGIFIAIYQEGEFITVVWDLENPEIRDVYREKFSDRWADKTWEFLLQSDIGTSLMMDNFTEFSFDAIK